MKRSLCLLLIIVQITAAVDIIRITKKSSCSRSAPPETETYFLNGSCQIKGASSTRQTVVNNILLTERFANSGCTGNPLVRQKRNATCDSTGQSFDIVSNLNSIRGQVLVTIDDCLHMGKIVVSPRINCNTQTTGVCRNGTAFYCGTESTTLYNALVTSSSPLVTGIIRSHYCSQENSETYQLNGGCYQSSRTYVVGNITTVETYENNECNGTFVKASVQSTYPNCGNGNSYAYEVISELPEFGDFEQIFAYSINLGKDKCGNVQRLNRNKFTTCPSSGRGVCSVLSGLKGFVFCGSDREIFLNPFMQTKEIGSEAK